MSSIISNWWKPWAQFATEFDENGLPFISYDQCQRHIESSKFADGFIFNIQDGGKSVSYHSDVIDPTGVPHISMYVSNRLASQNGYETIVAIVAALHGFARTAAIQGYIFAHGLNDARCATKEVCTIGQASIDAWKARMQRILIRPSEWSGIDYYFRRPALSDDLASDAIGSPKLQVMPIKFLS